MPDALSVSKTERNSTGGFFAKQYGSDDEDGSFKSAETGEKKFSQPQINAYTSVIENVVQNLQILGALGGSPIVPAEVEYKTVEQEYGPTEYRPSMSAPSMEHSGLKFQKDRGYLERILTELNLEVASSGEITRFLERLDEHDRSENERDGLLEEAESNRETLKVLQHLMETSRTRMKEKLHAKAREVQETAATYEDMAYENKIKQNYHNSWENSRTYQNNFLVNQKEGQLKDAVNSTSEGSRNEMRVHSEIEFYENVLQQECTELIEMWMRNYDKDLDNNETALQTIKQKRTDQLEALGDLQNEYNKREKEMSDYIKARELCLELEEKLRKTTEAATKIQAWWRWLMYRLRLGPYRKKGKNKNKKDKKRK